MYRNVLVAIKPDADPGPLLELALSVCTTGARLRLVSLVTVRQDEEPMRAMESIGADLEKAAARLRGEGFDADVLTAVVPSNAGHALSDYAEEFGADLMVIGLAKRSRVGKALLGSDAQAALMSAPCPVLAARL